MNWASARMQGLLKQYTCNDYREYAEEMVYRHTVVWII